MDDDQQTGTEKTFDIHQVIDQTRQVLTNPSGFYQSMPRSGGYTHPVVFVATMALMAGIVAAFFSFFTTNAGMLALGVSGIIVYPIFAVIGAFVAAAVVFVIWKLMGSEQDYETAFRCWSAATAIYPIAALLAIIPYIGVIVSILWGTYLMIEASVFVHGRKRQTARIVFGVLAAFMLISNISSEYASRHAAERISEVGKQFEGYEDMTPEEAGRKMGEFLKGFEQGAEQAGDDRDSGQNTGRE